MANTNGKLKLDKVDLTQERLMSAFFNAYNTNMDKLDKEATDLNIVKYYGGSVDANNITDTFSLGSGKNYPAGEFWYVLTLFFSSTNGACTQVAMSYKEDQRIYKRTRFDGAWSSWHIIGSELVDLASEAVAGAGITASSVSLSRHGRIAQFSANFTGIPAGWSGTLMTLPTRCRPRVNTPLSRIVGNSPDLDIPCHVLVNTSGVITANFKTAPSGPITIGGTWVTVI